MLQKPWFKLFIYFIATSFFFLISGVLISAFRPGPTEIEIMRFMEGFMKAMGGSLMGAAMNIEHNSTLGSIILFAANMTLPLIIIGLGLGFGIRLIHRRA